jgi:hypothetical protein
MITSACRKIVAGEGISEEEFGDSVANSYGKIAAIIGNELGIGGLEDQLREFALKKSTPRSVK